MGDSTRRHQSLRWRLTLTYVAVLALVLAALGVYQEITLRAELVATRADSLNADLDASKTAVLRSSRADQGNLGAMLRDLCAPNKTTTSSSRSLVQAFATVVTATSGRTVAVTVFDRGMHVAGASPKDVAQPQLAAPDLTLALSGVRTPARIVATADGDQLVVGFPLGTGRATCAVAQLSTSMQPINDAVAGQRRYLILGSLVGLVVALVVGLLLVGGALRPLQRLTRTADQLASGDLGARSDVRGRTDEVGALAEAFDAMAARIQESFAAQALATAIASESEARTRQFVADASHELRTPVTALKGYIDVMQRGAAHDPAVMSAALATMAREADRMHLLVLDLLTLARLDAQKTIVAEPVDIGALLAEVLDEGVPGMPDQVVRSFPPSPVIAMVDRNAVITIARNLLTNACKYAPGAPQRWTVTSDNRAAQFSVHDDGPGISAADQPHLFERFYRGEKTRTREEGGSGLGLSIVQALARAQHGDVAVESVEGEGTTLTVWLPLAPSGG